MKLVTFEDLKKEKIRNCSGATGSYRKMTSICKQLGEQASEAAPFGQKGKARKQTIQEAKSIMHGVCSTPIKNSQPTQKRRRR